MLRLRHRAHWLAERAALAAGLFGAGSPEDWDGRRIVFVCTGNICRSAFAHALGQARGLSVASCGTDTDNGLPADPVAVAEAAARGVDLSSHRTTRWSDVRLSPADVVVAAQLRHALAVAARARRSGCRVVTMSALLPVFEVVWDPHGRERGAYVQAFDRVERVVGRICELVGSRLGSRVLRQEDAG